MVERNVRAFQKSDSVPGIAWDPSLGAEVQYIFLARPNICGAGNSNTLDAGKIAMGVAVAAVAIKIQFAPWLDADQVTHAGVGQDQIVLPGWQTGPGPVMRLEAGAFVPVAEDALDNPRRNILLPGSKNIFVDMEGLAAGKNYVVEAPTGVMYDLPFQAVIDGKVQPVTAEVLKAARPDLYQ